MSEFDDDFLLREDNWGSSSEYSPNVLQPEDGIELEEVDSIPASALSDELIYPCAIIAGVMLQEELLFLSGKHTNGNTVLPLFVEFDGIIKRIGNFELSLESCQVLRMIADYKLSICHNSAKKTILDLNDENTLINMVRI